MIIGACGFTGSGSSAVMDYLSEYKSIYSFDDFEFTMTHSPDGLEDLDYQLNRHCAKYSSSVVAIERFRRSTYNYTINRIKDKAVRRKAAEATENFIQSITQVKWKGFGSAHYQLRFDPFYRNNIINMFSFKLANRIIKLMPGMVRKNWTVYPATTMEFSICPKDFDELAQKYVSSILELLGADSSKKILLDQPFCGNCPQNGFKFFKDPKAIIVDRDPRDLYVFTIEFFHKNGIIYQVPTDTVEHFVDYFLYMRENQPYLMPDENVLRIRFEDMVYNYQDTTRRISDFCNLSSSDRYRVIFNPKKSINNTQVFKRFKGYSKDIEFIEKKLTSFLFPFEKYPAVTHFEEMFNRPASLS